MGMKLHPQRLEFGVSETRLKFERGAFAFLRAAVKTQRVNEAHHNPINGDIELRAHEDAATLLFCGGAPILGRRAFGRKWFVELLSGGLAAPAGRRPKGWSVLARRPITEGRLRGTLRRT